MLVNGISKKVWLNEFFNQLDKLGIKRVITNIPFQGQMVKGRIEVIEIGEQRLILRHLDDLISCRYRVVYGRTKCIIESININNEGYKIPTEEKYLGIEKYFFIVGDKIINATKEEQGIFNWTIDN